jgi:uncharacterized protein YukE
MLLAELAIEKYAEAKGLDVKVVKQKWLPILEAEKEKDPFTESLVNACQVLGQIKEVGKGLDPATQEMLARLSSVAINRALDPEAQESDDGDEKLVKTIRRIKLLDQAFTDPDEVYERIASKVSQEVSAPLAQALTGLQETLKEIMPRVKAEPEVTQNPEFEQLAQTMENINTTLVKLAEKIDKGTSPPSEVQTDIESMVEQLSTATEKSKNFLSRQGFKVVAEEAPATFEEAKKIVEGRGFIIQDQRITREEAERLAREAAETERRKHEDELELKLEERKIAAAEKVVGTAIDKVMEPFKYFLERYLSTTVGELPVPEANPTPSPAPALQVAPSPAKTEVPAPKMVKIEGPPPQPEITPKPKVTGKRGKS